MASSAAGCVVIVGSGVIGRSWAMLFASGGFQVKLYDIEQQQIRNALENIRKEMKLLEQAGSLKGSLSVEEQLSLISGCPNIQEAVEGAMHIQYGHSSLLHWPLHPRSTKETGSWTPKS
ncbi:crystallin lambda 1 [Homo sapiens]|uniref:Crystallin lambda 1 n=1 Tax=Homo sapiens TaxID=9606 RepID=A0A2R8Y5S5_HUMAN|nr:crystallin lambda 1 [Homo sapiens]KAI4062811.1 crystallin lambda 1 [Homo sapiens]